MLAEVGLLQLLNLGPVGTGVFVGVLFVAAGLGYAAGVLTRRQPAAATPASINPSSNRGELLDGLMRSLDEASQYAKALANAPTAPISPVVVVEIEGRQSSLSELISSFFGKVRHLLPPAGPETPAQLRWQLDPADSVTGLPGEKTSYENLCLLVQAVEAGRATGCLLLARIDRFETLRERWGKEGCDSLLAQFSSVLCQGVNDKDLVVRSGTDTFMLLLNGESALEAARNAADIRNAIRTATFHSGKDGAALLLTASFGCASIQKSDAADAVLNRAETALSRSQRQGRNQLHVHDGLALVRCGDSG